MVKFQISYVQAGKLLNPIVQIKLTPSYLLRLCFIEKDNREKARIERSDW